MRQYSRDTKRETHEDTFVKTAMSQTVRQHLFEQYPRCFIRRNVNTTSLASLVSSMCCFRFCTLIHPIHPIHSILSTASSVYVRKQSLSTKDSLRHSIQRDLVLPPSTNCLHSHEYLDLEYAHVFQLSSCGPLQTSDSDL